MLAKALFSDYPLNDFNKTDIKRLLGPTDVEVKVQGHGRLSMWRRHPHRCWGIEVHLLVWCIECYDVLFLSIFKD